MKTNSFRIILLALSLIIAVSGVQGAVPTTEAVTDITNGGASFHATCGGNGTGYFKWGAATNSYKWTTPNQSFSGTFSDYQYGTPLLAGRTYFVVACADEGCGNAVSFTTLNASFPNQTAYGNDFVNLLHSGFNTTVILHTLASPYTNTVPGGAPVTWGLLFFFVFSGIWLRHKDILIPCMLAMTSGGAIWMGSSALGIPPEFAVVGQGLMYAAIAGIAVNWFSK
jgi:hypothetical protein